MFFYRNICLLFLTVRAFEAAHILGIFDYPSYSHQIVYQSLVKALSDRGHSLTILTVDPMNSEHPNITEIHMKNSYEININFVESRGLANLKLMYDLVFKTFQRIDNQLGETKVRNLIKNHQNYQFDLLIVEALFPTPYLVFGQLYEIPVIGISAIELSTTTHEIIGNSVNPAIHPDLIFPSVHGEVNFFERISSFFCYLGTKLIFKPFFDHLAIKIVSST